MRAGVAVGEGSDVVLLVRVVVFFAVMGTTQIRMAVPVAKDDSGGGRDLVMQVGVGPHERVVKLT